MSQNDLVLEDQPFPETLVDLNAIFQALATQSSGAVAPAITYPFQFWVDEATNALKMRNGNNDAWLTLAMINPATDRWEPRTDVFQALTAAGYTFKNAAGTTIGSLSNLGVLSGLSITLGTGKTLNISAATLTLADNQIDGVKVKAASGTERGTVQLASDAVGVAGTDTSKAMTAKATKAAIDAAGGAGIPPDFTAVFTSWSNETNYSAVHGLGATPSLIKAYWVCIAADGMYAVGDEVEALYEGYTFRGLWLRANSTTITGYVGAGVYLRSSGSFVQPTGTKWRLHLRAWK